MKDIDKMGIKEVSVAELSGVKIGHAQDYDAMTGVTAFVFEGRAVAGIDISGGGPASRETPLLNPKMACQDINAVILSGGSAFGLEAGCGAARYLEEQGIGFDTGYAQVPLVCQSCIYDLSIGKSDVRPDITMGYEACQNAVAGNDLCGSIGAGTGATVGKLTTMARSQKSGFGICTYKLGELIVTAAVTVNALGDIFDYDSGQQLAGMTTEDRKTFAGIEDGMYAGAIAGFSGCDENPQQGKNTTIGIIITNAELSKGDMNKVASMTRNAYSRCILPVGTTADGDSIYAVSVGKVTADINTVGTLAARTMGEAIKRAVITDRMDDKEYLAKCIEL